MKKLFWRFALVSLTVVVTPVLTACGGDDDETAVDNKTSTISDYVEPCFQWGASMEQVKSYMNGSSWRLLYDQYLLNYVDASEKHAITYMFRSVGDSTPGLYFCHVQYMGYTQERFSGIVAETEKRYKTKLTRKEEKTDGGTAIGYTGYATINAKNIGIMIMSDYAGEIDVTFAIPD